MSRFRGGGVALKPENSLKRAEELVGVSRVATAFLREPLHMRSGGLSLLIAVKLLHISC